MFINDICILVPYQGQGKRSLHRKIVKTFRPYILFSQSFKLSLILRRPQPYIPSFSYLHLGEYEFHRDNPLPLCILDAPPTI